MCYQGDVEGKRFDDRIFVSDFARLCRIVHKHVFLNLVESGNTVGCCHLKNGYILRSDQISFICGGWLRKQGKEMKMNRKFWGFLGEISRFVVLGT